MITTLRVSFHRRKIVCGADQRLKRLNYWFYTSSMLLFLFNTGRTAENEFCFDSVSVRHEEEAEGKKGSCVSFFSQARFSLVFQLQLKQGAKEMLPSGMTAQSPLSRSIVMSPGYYLTKPIMLQKQRGHTGPVLS